MCGSVAQAQPKPVYVAPQCPPPAPAPRSCPPVRDTFTPPVVRPESPVAQSAACAPPSNPATPAAADNTPAPQCAPERHGFGGMLRAIFTAVFSFIAAFMSAAPRAAPRDAERAQAPCDWRSFEGRRPQYATPAQDGPQRASASHCAPLRA